MACIGNMPSFKYVTVEGLVITYREIPYPIKAFTTNKKYIVWNIDRPYQLEDTNVRPESSLLEYLIVINDNGKPTVIEYDELLYSFDQSINGSNLVASTEYNALKTEVKGTTKKFNLMSETVDGMSQIIGATEDLEDGTIIYNLNKVKSDSKSYGISIGEIQTKIDDKYKDIKPTILNDLVEYLRSVSEYKLSFTTILEETLITNEELSTINLTKANMISKSTKLKSVLNELKVIIDSLKDVEKSSLVTEMINQINTLQNALISICDSYLQDNKISGEEKTNIVKKTYELTTYLGVVQNTCNNITVNGQAGVVYSIENELLMLKDSTTSSIKELTRSSDDLTENIKNQSSEISQMKDSISGRVDSVETDITNITSTTNKLNTGLNKWLVEMFDRGEATGTSAISIDDLVGKTPTKTFLVDDTTSLIDVSDKYLARWTTNVYLENNYSWAVDAISDDEGTLYLNGRKIANTGLLVTKVILHFQQGWNKITWVYNEDTGHDGCYFSTKVSSLPQVKIMMAYAQTNVNEDVIAMSEVLTNTKTKVSELEIDLSGVTSRVSDTENSISTVNNEVVNLETRVHTAEEQITSDAIINTVSGEFYKKNETDEKYTSQSQFKQTIDNFEFAFKNNAKNNMVRNGKFKAGISYYSKTHANDVLGSGTELIALSITEQGRWGGISTESIDCEENTLYTMFIQQANEIATPSSYYTMQVISKVIFLNAADNIISSENLTIRDWEVGFAAKDISNINFTTPLNCTKFKIEYAGIFRDAPSDRTLRIYCKGLCVTKGNNIGYFPSTDEIYSESVKIDTNGITVKHNSGAYSVFNSEGSNFYSKDGADMTSLRNGGIIGYHAPTNEMIGHIFPTNKNNGDIIMNGWSISNSLIGDYIAICKSNNNEEGNFNLEDIIICYTNDVEHLGGRPRGTYFDTLDVNFNRRAFFNDHVYVNNKAILFPSRDYEYSNEIVANANNNNDLEVHGCNLLTLGIRHDYTKYPAITIVKDVVSQNRCHGKFECDFDLQGKMIHNGFFSGTFWDSYDIPSGETIDVNNNIDVLIACEESAIINKDGEVKYNINDMVKLLYSKIHELENEIKILKAGV